MGGPFIFLMSLFSVSFVKDQGAKRLAADKESSVSHWISDSVMVNFKGVISLGKDEKNSLFKKKKKNFTKTAFSGDGKWPRNNLERLILKMNLTLTWHWKMKMDLVRHFLTREMPLVWHSFWWEATFRGEISVYTDWQDKMIHTATWPVGAMLPREPDHNVQGARKEEENLLDA